MANRPSTSALRATYTSAKREGENRKRPIMGFGARILARGVQAGQGGHSDARARLAPVVSLDIQSNNALYRHRGLDRMAGGRPMSDDLELTGRRALVTGGTQGIGQAVVSRLREAGATVLTTARTAPTELAEAKLFVAADVATAEVCAIVAQAVRDRLGGSTSLSTSSEVHRRQLGALPCS